MAKITRTTVKTFINKNRDSLYINVTGNFDGMTDSVESQNGGFVKAGKDYRVYAEIHTLRVEGLWLVGDGRDHFKPYDDGVFAGFEYCNCCGNGVIAVKKPEENKADNALVEIRAEREKYLEEHPNFRKECKNGEVYDLDGNIHKQPGECQSLGYNGCIRSDCCLGHFRFNQFVYGSICSHPVLGKNRSDYIAQGDHVKIIDKKNPYYNESGHVYLVDGTAYYVTFGKEKSVFLSSQLEIAA